uniref:VHS domain-containing protein n=1 Tax=Chromera velia CCMP2878 TaxID=1169474 RepID=A0A0G4HVZ7_9ALVE|eukprot:Cvel_8967.t1-p1 / transcript=Cvel_8967.t1 / gene=Cvel_8967 / organism=Chromera_velia_CCMP2878 / gene_product=hypothetical protein / transcript_product=hypothetical protein / location=Cvel_scaffold505:80455-83492(+) / protein_length=212 / sequence_SO=supercontig / SO=protein_coding / is_pseudo=false
MANTRISETIIIAVSSDVSLSAETNNLAHELQACMGTATGPKNAVQGCMDVIQDKSQTVTAKINAIKILDYFIALIENQKVIINAVASAFTDRHLKTFVQLGRKSKDKSAKRKIDCLPSSASREDQDRFLAGILEFIAKWGDAFKDRTGSLKNLSKERDKLKAEGVQFPSSREFINLPEATEAPMPPKSGGRVPFRCARVQGTFSEEGGVDL